MVVLRSSLQFYDFMQKCCCGFFVVIEGPSISCGLGLDHIVGTMCGLGLDHMVGAHNATMLTKIMIS